MDTSIILGASPTPPSSTLLNNQNDNVNEETAKKIMKEDVMKREGQMLPLPTVWQRCKNEANYNYKLSNVEEKKDLTIPFRGSTNQRILYKGIDF